MALLSDPVHPGPVEVGEQTKRMADLVEGLVYDGMIGRAPYPKVLLVDSRGRPSSYGYASGWVYYSHINELCVIVTRDRKSSPCEGIAHPAGLVLWEINGKEDRT